MSTETLAPLPVSPPNDRRWLIEIAVPVYNEEHVLTAAIHRLHGYLSENFPFPFRITIADNASTDGTWVLARALSAELGTPGAEVRAVHLDLKGRGRALRKVWGDSDADVVTYMDVDLSTDLGAFLPLVAPLITGHSDLAIGSRLTRGSAVVRGPKREIISRCYNLLLRTTLRAHFSDAQCGFKAGRTEVVQALLPLVEDEAWFFDTELLLLAERSGLRIHEVPVDWTDDPDSRVDIARTVRDDLRGMARVGRRMLTGGFGAPLPTGMARQLPRFAVIGVLSTLVQLVLFLALRTGTGVLTANALSLLMAAVLNTAANRRFTFGVTGRAGVVRAQIEGGLAVLLGLALSTGGLALTTTLAPAAPRWSEVATLVTANALATLLRFVLLRAWVFHPRRAGRAAAPSTDPRWARPALLGVLALAALLYGWNLSAAGDANSYYAAAVMSGTHSWKAFFYGALDSGSFITVDKPPVALWLMGLSARVFGYSTQSMLLPQAAAGVATVGVLHATVRRTIAGTPGIVAGLLAALVLTLTPMTVAIDRDNNPDPVLTLLLVLAAWALVRALRDGPRWLLLSMALVGLAFNTKDLQAFVVLPALGLTYLCCARPSLPHRVGQLLAGTAVLVVSAGWWMVLVDAIPASSRPYIGSSERNSVWNLVIGYNGLGRILGNHRMRFFEQPFDPHGFATGGSYGQTGQHGLAGAAGFGSRPGIGRMFDQVLGGQISWLLPFALLSLVAVVVTARRAGAAALLWGGWLGVNLVVYSLSKGGFHPYYTATMAPAIGALAGIGAVLLYTAPRPFDLLLPLSLVVTGAWSVALLRRTPDWNPWLIWAVAGCVAYGAAALLVRTRTRIVAAGLGIGLAGALAGPAAYAITPLAGLNSGNNPLAGPQASRNELGRGEPAGLPGVGTAPRYSFSGLVSPELIDHLQRHRAGARWLVAVANARSAATIILRTGRPVIAMGGFSGRDPAMTVPKLRGYIDSGALHYVLVGDDRNRMDPAVVAWVQSNCAPDNLGAPGLYRCWPAP